MKQTVGFYRFLIFSALLYSSILLHAYMCGLLYSITVSPPLMQSVKNLFQINKIMQNKLGYALKRIILTVVEEASYTVL